MRHIVSAITISAILLSFGLCYGQSDNRDMVEQNLKNIVGVKLPKDASDVEGRTVRAMTFVFDCSFFCSKNSLGNLLGELRSRNSDIPSLNSLEVLKMTYGARQKSVDTSWKAKNGIQYVIMWISNIDKDNVKVEFKTTHEMN